MVESLCGGDPMTMSGCLDTCGQAVFGNTAMLPLATSIHADPTTIVHTDPAPQPVAGFEVGTQQHNT